ncbi:MAG: pyridoxamine 5'-phosphate oxidase [Myxococcales bacterium]|nr:pyridoxamine 5'-phosphate oxidase [Myxococcales bacterium]
MSEHLASEPGDDPIARFLELWTLAAESEPLGAAPCVLATVSAEGRPSARTMLLKGADAEGFVFYTNFGSRKAQELDANRFAALSFHWPSIGVAARVEGPTERVSDAEADAYFATRPRLSQIGAWASRQSQEIESRQLLEDAIARFEARFEDAPVPRPEFWGGYRLEPDAIELWHDQQFRLHDRFLFRRAAAGWTRSRLSP